MAVQHVELADIRSSWKRIFANTKTTATISRLLMRTLVTYLGFGKYGLRLPINWKILAF